jgi:hypothetical protein
VRHRCPAPLTLVAAALALYVGVRPNVARADAALAIPTDTSFDPTTGNYQVIFDVGTSDGIVPPASTDGSANGPAPLTILNGSSSSLLVSGALFVGVRDTTLTSGASSQQLGLAFTGSGFASNGILQFSLDVNGSLPTPPQLSFDSASPFGSSSGLEIINPTSFTTNTSSGATATYTLEAVQTVPAPEPLSIWLWLMLAAAALYNVRRMRRKEGAIALA